MSAGEEHRVEQGGPSWTVRVEDDVLVFAYSGSPTFAALKSYARETVARATASGFTKVLSDLTGLEASPGAVERLNATMGDFQQLVARLDSTIVPLSEDVRRATEQATMTMAQLDSTLAEAVFVIEGARGVIEPESLMFVQFERAMLELGAASRSLRELADYLERNPSALVRGRPGGQ